MTAVFRNLSVKAAFDILATKRPEQALLALLDEVGPDELKPFIRDIRSFAEGYLADALEGRLSRGAAKATKVLHALTEVMILVIEEENL